MNAYTQTSDSLTFTKGRSLTSLYGALTNQAVKTTSNGQVRTTGYTIGTKSGYFIKNNWALGANFSLSRYEFNDASISNQSEDLLFGLWNRLYFAETKSSALFSELTAFYSSIYTNSEVLDNGGTIVSHEEVRGGGFGIEPGLGWVYILNRNIGFGLTLSYNLANLQVDINDLVLDASNPDTFLTTQLRFSFNFQIYLDQFFF